MSEFFEMAKEIVRGECDAGPTALRRIRKGDLDLSDRDLVRGAREALRLDDVQAALLALDELALRKAMDGPVR